MPYLEDMCERFWEYRAQEFNGMDQAFDRPAREGLRPPVFVTGDASLNILTDPNLHLHQRQRLIQVIPPEKRHRWFGSMKSSQALAQSLFGTLMVTQNAAILQQLATVDDPNFFPFQPDQDRQASIALEANVEHLGEPTPTSLDVIFAGARRVAIECKLMEERVSPCSRADLSEAKPGHCNGNHEVQHGRETRCSYTEIGVQYWNILPAVFGIDSAIDQAPCPLRDALQLVRNVLGICIEPDGAVARDSLAVLLYDARNPAFQPGGAGYAAFFQIRAMLHEPAKLQRCTWQDLVTILRGDPELNWLTVHLAQKYGF